MKEVVVDSKEKSKKKSVWVLADDRAGNVSQVMGIAEALPFDYEVKNIRYNKISKIPNILKGKSLIGVNQNESDDLSNPYPDIIISAGRKTSTIARYIKEKSGGKSFILQLMWPDSGIKDFDLIVIPEHDNILPKDNIVNSIGAPNKINDELLSFNKAKWQDKFANLPGKKVALLVGGNTKKGKFTTKHAMDLANDINKFAKKIDASLLITTSRRTSDEAVEILKNNIKVPYYFYNFRSEDENPYMGFLAVSDIIIVSGDSISMCSEACSTGKQIYVYAPSDLIPNKHRLFHKGLYINNMARPFTGEVVNWDVARLDDTSNICKRLLKAIKLS